MKEQWIKWEPVGGLSARYSIKRLVDDVSVFTLYLSDIENPKKRVEVIFDSFIVSYRNTDESYCDKFAFDLRKEYGADFYVKWTFFRVLNSEYIQWVCQQAGEPYTSEDFYHFSLLTYDGQFDIVATYEPKVIVINEP